jgi:hypothetical protein
MPRSGVIGEQIYDQVEKLVADGMNRTQAFAEISKESGRQAGTVAANYYRVARKRAGGSVRKPRAARGSRSDARTPGRTARRPAAASSDIEQIAAQLLANMEALTAALREQDAEVKELRSRLDGVKKLLG